MTKNIKVNSITFNAAQGKSITGYFEIDNGNSVYRLMKKMTAPMNQDKLAKFYETEKQKGNPIPLNSIQMFELFNDAVKSGNKDLMNYLQEGLQIWPNTLTRVIYNVAGKEDKTIHNYGTSDAYFITGNIVGNVEWIKEINNLSALEILTGTKDIQKLNEISNKINSTSMYFWRFDSKPSEKDERVGWFGAGEDRFLLIAGANLPDEGPTFLVEKVK